MRVVLDTNVFISGVFFSGPPSRILEAWRDGSLGLVISAEIVEEYRRVGERLSSDFPGVSLDPFLILLVTHADLVVPETLPGPVVTDPDDDKFFACALGGDCRLIVSGDKALLAASGFEGVEVETPRRFLDRFGPFLQ